MAIIQRAFYRKKEVVQLDNHANARSNWGAKAVLRRLAEFGRHLQLPRFHYAKPVAGEMIEPPVSEPTERTAGERDLPVLVQPITTAVSSAPAAGAESGTDYEVLPELLSPHSAAVPVEGQKTGATDDRGAATCDQPTARSRSLEELAESRPAADHLIGLGTNKLRNPFAYPAQGAAEGSLPEHWTTQSTATFEVVGRGGCGSDTNVDIRIYGGQALTNQVLNFETLAGIAAAPGQEWAASTKLRVVSGTLHNVTLLAMRLRSGRSNDSFLEVALGNNLVEELTASRNEDVASTIMMALNVADTEAVTGGIAFAASGPFDFTLRISGAKLTQDGGVIQTGNSSPAGTDTDMEVEGQAAPLKVADSGLKRSAQPQPKITSIK